MIKNKPPQSIRSLLMVAVVSLGVSVAAAEIVLRILDLPVYTYVMGDLAYDLNRETLYQITPNCREDINSLGYRDREIPAKSARKKRILMYGDSFLIGLNVRPQQTIPKLMESALQSSCEVFNMGVYGYGPDQSYLRMEKEIDALKPDFVLLELFPANDFNDLYKDRLFEISKDGKLLPNRHNLVAASLPGCRFCTLAYKALTGHYFDSVKEKALAVDLFRDTYDWDLLLNPASQASRKKILLMRGILETIAQYFNSRKIPFAVVILPSMDNIQDAADFQQQNIPKSNYFLAEDLAVRICLEEKIPVLSLQKPFENFTGAQLFEPRDGHLTAAGNQLAADAITNWISNFPVLSH